MLTAFIRILCTWTYANVSGITPASKLHRGHEREVLPEWEAERGNPVGACHLTRHSRRALVRDVPTVSVSLGPVEPNSL